MIFSLKLPVLILFGNMPNNPDGSQPLFSGIIPENGSPVTIIPYVLASSRTKRSNQFGGYAHGEPGVNEQIIGSVAVWPISGGHYGIIPTHSSSILFSYLFDSLFLHPFE